MLKRHLDEIPKCGSIQLFSEVLYEVCLKQGSLQGSINLDSMLLSLYGDYENYLDACPLPALRYSTDHRPDLKQISVTLIRMGKASIPV